MDLRPTGLRPLARRASRKILQGSMLGLRNFRWGPPVRTTNSLPARDVAPLLSAVAFFFLLTAYYIVRPVRDQLGGAVGAQQLPLFYLATFVAMLLLTPLFGALVARVRRRRLL